MVQIKCLLGARLSLISLFLSVYVLYNGTARVKKLVKEKLMNIQTSNFYLSSGGRGRTDLDLNKLGTQVVSDNSMCTQVVSGKKSSDEVRFRLSK